MAEAAGPSIDAAMHAVIGSLQHEQGQNVTIGELRNRRATLRVHMRMWERAFERVHGWRPGPADKREDIDYARLKRELRRVDAGLRLVRGVHDDDGMGKRAALIDYGLKARLAYGGKDGEASPTAARARSPADGKGALAGSSGQEERPGLSHLSIDEGDDDVELASLASASPDARLGAGVGPGEGAAGAPKLEREAASAAAGPPPPPAVSVPAAEDSRDTAGRWRGWGLLALYRRVRSVAASSSPARISSPLSGLAAAARWRSARGARPPAVHV